ncbi:MAG: ArnT family glycosyltransferase [Armatimonadota bacterium]
MDVPLQSISEDRVNSVAKIVALVVLLVLIGPAALWATYASNFKGLVLADAMDYAQIARNIAEGQGFTTSVVRPLGTAFSGQISRVPDTTHPPLFTLALAIMFGAFGISDATVVLTSGLFFLLTIPVVYILARRLFGRRVALISTIVYVLGERMIQYALSGTNITLAAFLTTLMLLALHSAHMTHADPNRSGAGVKQCAAAGFLLGLCYLTEYAFALALIPAAIYILATHNRRRFASTAAFLLSFGLATAPWMIRNYTLTGSPVFGLRSYELVMMTSTHPAYTLYRSTEIRPLAEMLGGQAAQILKKWLIGLQAMYEQIPSLAGGWLMPLFLAGFLHLFRRRGADSLRALALLMMGAVLIASVLLQPNIELLVPFVPFITIMAVAFAVHLLNSLGMPRTASTLAAAAVVAVLAVPTVLRIAAPLPTVRDVGASHLMAIKRGTPENTVVVSDVPWAVAWYANRTSIWLPNNERDFAAVDKKGRIDAIYLSSMLLRYPANEMVSGWQSLQRQAVAVAVQTASKPIHEGVPFVAFGNTKFMIAIAEPRDGTVILVRSDSQLANALRSKDKGIKY